VVLLSLGSVALASSCCKSIATGLGVSEISPEELVALQRAGTSVAILDVRSAAAYEASHIPGAVRVGAGHEGLGVPVAADGASVIVVVCEKGHESLLAASALRSRTDARTVSLAGGMRAWRDRNLELFRGAGSVQTVAVGCAVPPETAGKFEAVAVVLTAYGLKPAYMVLSAVLIAVLWRRREESLKLLRWGLIGFLVGESFCAADYLLTGGVSGRLEALHGLGMLVMGALLPWAVFELLDARVLRFTDPTAGCAGARLCTSCWKRDPVACPVHRLFLVAVPAMAVLAVMPLTAPIEALSLVRLVWGTPVNYEVGPAIQLLQFRLYPLLASALFTVAFVLLLRGRRGIRPARVPFFAAVGLASFSLFRFFLLEAYRQVPGWKDAWEEITEFAVIVGVAVALHSLRHQVGLVRRPTEGSGASAPEAAGAVADE